MGLAYFCLGEWEEAVTAAEKALKLNPETFTAAGYLAAVYAHLGRDKEAKAAAQNSLGVEHPTLFFLRH